MLAGSADESSNAGASVTFNQRQSWFLAECAALVERCTGWGLPSQQEGQETTPAQGDALARGTDGLLPSCKDSAVTRGALLAAYAGSLRIGTALAVVRRAYMPFAQAIELGATTQNHEHGHRQQQQEEEQEEKGVCAGAQELRTLTRMLLRAKRYDAAALLRGGVLPAADHVLLGAAKAREAELAAAAAAGMPAPGDGGIAVLPPPAAPTAGSIVMLPFEHAAREEASTPALAAFVANAGGSKAGGDAPAERTKQYRFEYDGTVHAMLILAEARRGELDRALSLLLEVQLPPSVLSSSVHALSRTYPHACAVLARSNLHAVFSLAHAHAPLPPRTCARARAPETCT